MLLGGIYAIAAFGLAICFGVLSVLNVAHGDFLMLAAMASYGIFAIWGLNPFTHIIIILPLFFTLGMLVEALLIRPIAGKPHHQMLVSSILITLGISLVAQDVMAFFWGQPYTSIPFSLPSLKIGGVIIPSIRLLILGVVSVIAICLQFYLKRSFLGRAIRAVTQNREGAMVVGVNLDRVSMLAFGLGISLAAMAGIFYVVLYSVTPSIGIPLTVRYLCVIVLGGLGSLVGVLLSGLILGLVEVTAGYTIGPQWAPTVAFFLLILILLIRPRGLLGEA